VHSRVLAQIKCREMKAKGINTSPQMLEATLGENPTAIGDKRAVESGEIVEQLAAAAIGQRVADGVLRRFEFIECSRGHRQPRIDPSDSSPIRLVSAVGRLVG
jgi:hypothetical protein